ncbi:MAG TPA: RluA family pseudouridine synthase, partial [Clostridia bacterium]
MILKCTVNEELAGKTVKHILKNHLLLSERLVKRLKYDNKILINGIPVHINASTNYGDILEANIYFEEYPDGIIPEDIQIDIIHEDDYIIAVNKHPGIVVHPTSTHPSGTIANALTSHLFKKGVYLKVRPVIRLDRDTSGVIIFAKNQYVQEHLIRQMNAKTFKKEYVGVVHGRPAPCGTIDLPIDRKPESIMLRHVSPDG